MRALNRLIGCGLLAAVICPTSLAQEEPQDEFQVSRSTKPVIHLDGGDYRGGDRRRRLRETPPPATTPRNAIKVVGAFFLLPVELVILSLTYLALFTALVIIN